MSKAVSLQKWIDDTMGGVAEVAKALGVSKAIVYRWYYGEGAPKAENILDLVKLGKGKLTADSILADTFKKPEPRRAPAKKAAATKSKKKSTKKAAASKSGGGKKVTKKKASAKPKAAVKKTKVDGEKKAAPKKSKKKSAPKKERQGATAAPKDAADTVQSDPLA